MNAELRNAAPAAFPEARIKDLLFVDNKDAVVLRGDA